MTSFLCAVQVSSKVKWVYPADPVPQFNHKHDLLWFLHRSGTEWTTQGVKVQAGKKKKEMIKRGAKGKASDLNIIPKWQKANCHTSREILWKQDNNIKSHSPAQGTV